MKRIHYATILLAIVLLATVGCGSKHVCSIQRPAEVTVAITTASINVLDAQGLLPQEVKAEYERFLPCAEKFLADLEGYCAAEDAAKIRAKLALIRASREHGLCTAADVIGATMMALDAIMHSGLKIPDEVKAFYGTFRECGERLVASLHEHGGC